ncbi:MAG: four helix bundle protein [bacterium]|nr:four helix bundle protein [bacterium]
MRARSREILKRIIEANGSPDRASLLERLRGDLENFKVLARLCHESGGFSSTRAYLHVAEQVVGISRQNEGWLRQTLKGDPSTRCARSGQGRSGEAGHGQNRAG